MTVCVCVCVCVLPQQLDDVWGELLQQYQMMLYESIGYYGNAIKEMEDLGGGLCNESIHPTYGRLTSCMSLYGGKLTPSIRMDL